MGYNSNSFPTSSQTYFTLRKGFNADVFAVDISRVFLFLDGSPYLQTVNITVTSSQGSYETVAENGFFVLYPYTDVAGTPIQHTITARATGIRGELIVTPTPSGDFVLNLELLQCINRPFAFDFNPFGFRVASFQIGGGCVPFCDDESGLGCNNQIIRDRALNMPPLVQGDTLSFMLNEEIAQDYSTYKVALLDSGFNFVLQNITLNQYDNGNSTFTYYASLTVPCVDTGCYYIAIYNPADDFAVYITKPFKDANRTNWREQTRVLKYRNSVNLAGYKFEELPSFYNQIRLDINQSSYRYQSDKTSYREQSTKATRNIQSTTDKYITFKCFQFDEALHNAMALAFDCDEIYLDSEQFRSLEAYEPNAEETEDLSNGNIELYRVGFSYSSKSC